MTELELAEIEARAAAATPGRWYYTTDGDYDEWADASLEWISQLWSTDDPEGLPGKAIASFEEEATSEDAEFLAHARADIPALVAEVRRLQGAEAELRQRLSRAEGSAGHWRMLCMSISGTLGRIYVQRDEARAERDQARKWAVAWKASAKHDRGLLRAAMRFIAIVSSVDAPRRDSEGVWHDPPHKRT